MTNEKNNVAIDGDEVKTKRKEKSTWGTVRKVIGPLLTLGGILLGAMGAKKIGGGGNI